LAVSRFDIITRKRAIHPRPDATLLALHGEQHDTRLGLADP
jgi:hypothetical protein